MALLSHAVPPARRRSVLCGAKAALAVLAAYRAEAGLGFNADAFRWADGKSVASGLPLLTVAGAGAGPAAGMTRASPGRGGVEGGVIGDGLVRGTGITARGVALCDSAIHGTDLTAGRLS